MSDMGNKMEQMINLAHEIREENERIGALLLDGLQLSFSILDDIRKHGNDLKELDISKRIEMVSDHLGFDLEQLVLGIFEKNYDKTEEISNKAVDEDTISFITAQTDDYETFLAENEAEKIKDNLAELRNEI